MILRENCPVVSIQSVQYQWYILLAHCLSAVPFTNSLRINEGSSEWQLCLVCLFPAAMWEDGCPSWEPPSWRMRWTGRSCTSGLRFRFQRAAMVIQTGDFSRCEGWFQPLENTKMFFFFWWQGLFKLIPSKREHRIFSVIFSQTEISSAWIFGHWKVDLIYVDRYFAVICESQHIANFLVAYLESESMVKSKQEPVC